MKKIITISRQYGSGGREIGQKLAEHYNIPFYDNEIITRVAKESGFAEETFARAEDKATNSLLYSLAMGINVYAPIIRALLPFPVPALCPASKYCQCFS